MMALDPTQIDQLVASGAVSPATANALKAKYGAPPALATDLVGPIPTAPPAVTVDSLGIPAAAPPPSPAMATPSGAPTAAGAAAVTSPEAIKKAQIDAALGSVGSKPTIDPVTGNLNLPPSVGGAGSAATFGNLGKKIEEGTGTFDPTTGAGLTPKEAKEIGIPMPAKKSGGAGGAAKAPMTPEDLLRRIYTPGQLKQFGLTEKQLTDEGARDVAMADIAQEDALHRKVLLQNATEDAENIIAHNEEREEERQKVIAAARDSLQSKWDELSKTEIDPNRYWNSKDTGEKILGGIGLLLSGFGSGLGGGPNLAMQMMESNVNRDVEAQKATFAAKSESVKAQQSLYGQMVAEYGDERIADQATLATHWQQISNQLQTIAAGTQNDVAKQNALDAVKFADNKVQQYSAGVEAGAELAWKQIQAQQAAAQAAAAAAAKKRADEVFKGKWDVVLKRAEALGGNPSVDDKGEPIVVKDGKIIWDGTKDGTGESGVSIGTGYNDAGQLVTAPGVAKSKEAAGKFDEQTALYNKKMQLLDKIDKLYGEYGKESFGDAKTKAKTYAAELRAIEKKELSIKGFTDKADDMLDAMIPEDPLEREFLSPFSDPNLTKLQAYKDQVKGEYEAAQKSLLKPGAGGGNDNTLTTLGK